MDNGMWVDLPKTEAHRALTARLALGLERADAGPLPVSVRYHDETPEPTNEHLLVVLGPNDPNAMLQAVENGAAGYVPIERSTEEMVAAIVAVSHGEAHVPDEMLGALLRRIVERRRTPTTLPSLTEREAEIFALAARGSNKFDIGSALGISPATARTHLSNIMKKLDVRSHAELVAKAASMGLDTTPEER